MSCQTDISIFDAHRERMVQVLKRASAHTYGLSLELAEKYAERNLVHDAMRQQKPLVILTKRISETGHLLFGVSRPSADPTDRPDPNGRKNEVHVPIRIISMPPI
mgnify:CR=1 FL=1